MFCVQKSSYTDCNQNHVNKILTQDVWLTPSVLQLVRQQNHLSPFNLMNHKMSRLLVNHGKAKLN